MSVDSSDNTSASNSTDQGQQPQRKRRTNAEIAADLAEKNRPPRQSGRPIDGRERRGNIDMGELTALFSGGDEAPPEKPSRSDPKRPGSDARGDDAGRYEEEEDESDSPKERPALDLDEDGDEEEKPKKKRPKSLTKFAEENGLDAAKLHDLTVTYDDGESISIGTLKDHYRESGDLQRRSDDFEDYRTHSQNEILMARQQIDGVLQRLTSVVPPEHLARAFADYEHDAAERARADKLRLREWFPEWDDLGRKNADKESLTKVLGSYGFSPFEVDTIKDARIIRFAIHGMRLMQRYERLKEAYSREKVPSKVPPSRQPGRRPNRDETAKRQAEGGDVVGAVATLIR